MEVTPELRLALPTRPIAGPDPRGQRAYPREKSAPRLPERAPRRHFSVGAGRRRHRCSCGGWSHVWFHRAQPIGGCRRDAPAARKTMALPARCAYIAPGITTTFSHWPMQPSLAVLNLSDSFCELWPKLARSAGADLRSADKVTELKHLDEACAVLLAAGGAERDAVAAIEALLRRESPPIAVVGVEKDYRLVASLLRSGADNYFALPDDLGTMRGWISERTDATVGNARAALMAAEGRARYDFSRMIGRSPCLLDALQRATRVIPRGSATVLLTGETGTGKELLARAIHYNGPRAAKPLIEINCSALPENLLEAELFGYEAGAFTDARVAKPGLLEAASGGTLFLDEVGDLSPNLQGKLLRVLEDKRVRRLGSVRDQEVDVRIIAATHVDLYSATAEGKFRQDLYYRLSVLPIHLPPLRERGEDILLLASTFLDRFAAQYDLSRSPLGPDIKRVLMAHPWPGNVRELRNAIERAMLLGDGALRREHLFVGSGPSSSPARAPSFIPFPASMHTITSAAARAMTEYCGGNKSEAAKVLGISRRHLYVLLRNGEG
jgi:DNA-binding NtrC family response regulator